MSLRPLHAATTALTLLAAGIVAVATPAAATSATATPATATADAPVEVMGSNPLAAFTEIQSDGVTSPQTQIVPATDTTEFSQALQVTVGADAKSYGLDGEYSIGVGAPSTTAVASGDWMVGTLWARATSVPSGTAETEFVFEQDGGSYAKSLNVPLSFTGTWQKFQFPFRMSAGYPTAGAHISLWLGYGQQTIQVGGVSILDYGQSQPAGYPTVTYDGRNADAPWRAAAESRIDQYRKGNLTVKVVDSNGNPVSGAAVTADQTKQEFKFGTADDASHLLADNSDGARIREIQQSNYNQASLGNNLKWSHWENATERKTLTYPAIQWLRDNNKAFRGHNLVWPSSGNVPADIAALKSDPAALRAAIDAHVTDETSSLKGMVDEWDVVNEPYSDHDIRDAAGADQINNWYTLAHQGDPGAKLFLNDYDLIEDNGNDIRHQDYDYSLIQSMLAKGTPIQAVGMESHFTGQLLTSPDNLLKLFDKWSGLGLPLEVTEFDVATDDQQLQADYTRDFMTMAFSYPNMTGINMFGFWAGNIYNPQVALYNTDWSEKPNGQVWGELVNHEWRTDVSGQTAANGNYMTRGFLGDYTVDVTVGGVTKTVNVSMPKNNGATVTVIADGVASPPAALPNSVHNGGFDNIRENSPVSWTELAPGWKPVSDAASGTGALRLYADSGVSQNLLDVTPGATYTLSGTAKQTGTGGNCYIGVRGGSTAGTATFQHTLNYTTEQSYTRKAAGFTIPAGTTWSQVYAWQNAGPSATTCTVDDITLTRESGPAPVVPTVAPTAPLTATLLTNGDLESGTTNGFYCLGTCTPAVSTSALTGSHGLQVTGRAAAWAGPAQGVTVGLGGHYDSSAWVRLSASGTDTAQVELKVYTSTATTTFALGTAAVNGSGWYLVSAQDVPINAFGTFQKAEWWVSTASGTEDLLVDDAALYRHATQP